ncbi:TetR/AcrR family transcriptional regulator [Nonomuraea lactucae]|uniref:TetR/AcrR family transcriptional regulator n=1 Tax=Nonomuraea lactucae TaxID=2249762 RepID=UPI000DE25128|nr:TetR/AcrR family transcriptional regulator [Nonomuraea lactucae]
MNRAAAKERNRRALLDAARRIVARDGYRAKLDEIAEHAGLTTGAVYSLFGSKDGLLIALAADYFGPHHERITQALTPDMDLAGAAEAFARYYRSLCDDPGALGHLTFEISLYDMALRDPALRAKLADSELAHEEGLAALFAGRSHGTATTTEQQARRLARALRALLSGLSRAVILGLPEAGTEHYFATTARALTTSEVLGPP